MKGKDGTEFDIERWIDWVVSESPSHMPLRTFERTDCVRRGQKVGGNRNKGRMACPGCFTLIGRASKTCPHCGVKIR